MDAQITRDSSQYGFQLAQVFIHVQNCARLERVLSLTNSNLL